MGLSRRFDSESKNLRGVILCWEIFERETRYSGDLSLRKGTSDPEISTYWS